MQLEDAAKLAYDTLNHNAGRNDAEPFEHLSVRERGAWIEAISAVWEMNEPEPDFSAPSCQFCQTQMECPDCDPPECEDCKEDLVCPECGTMPDCPKCGQEMTLACAICATSSPVINTSPDVKSSVSRSK